MKLLKIVIEFLKHLKHPNIIKFFCIKKTKENYFINFEYCNGGNLSKIYETYQQKYGKLFSLEIIEHLMKQIIEAVNYLHQMKIIHNNINLNNILINYEKKRKKRK